MGRGGRCATYNDTHVLGVHAGAQHGEQREVAVWSAAHGERRTYLFSCQNARDVSEPMRITLCDRLGLCAIGCSASGVHCAGYTLCTPAYRSVKAVEKRMYSDMTSKSARSKGDESQPTKVRLGTSKM